MTKRANSIVDIIFYGSLLILLLWVIGKSIGLIHSPVWVEMVPWASFVFATGAFYQKMSAFCSDIKEIKPIIKDISSRVIVLETKETLYKEHVEKLDVDIKDIKIRKK